MDTIIRKVIVTITLSCFAIFYNANAQTTCGYDKPINVAKLDWGSAQFSNAIVKFILDKGYGCKINEIAVDTMPALAGLGAGDIDIMIEIWPPNVAEAYGKLLKDEKVVQTKGISITAAIQGFYVPRYIVEGDEKRGIKPSAPDLKSVEDLKKHYKLFKDPEDPSKGRFLNCLLGWSCEKVNTAKLEAYGLDQYFTNFRPGGGAALDAEFESAYKRGEPVLGYYWEPSWLLGSLDMLKLEEPPFDQEAWSKLENAKSGKGLKATAYPTIEAVIAVNKNFANKAPTVVSFLDNIRLETDTINKALVYMRDFKRDADEKAARNFLKNNPNTWQSWVPKDVAERVMKELESE